MRTVKHYTRYRYLSQNGKMAGIDIRESNKNIVSYSNLKWLFT
jgi:hypothetical protein